MCIGVIWEDFVCILKYHEQIKKSIICMLLKISLLRISLS